METIVGVLLLIAICGFYLGFVFPRIYTEPPISQEESAFPLVITVVFIINLAAIDVCL